MDELSARISFHDLLSPRQSMLDDILVGLAQPQKRISPKYFYDARGCRLFDAICGLPEYYPTRAELSIMRSCAGAMREELGAGCTVIEIGCGSSEKTRLLLNALRPTAFVPIDIASEQLASSCQTLAPLFPAMDIVALRADFALPVVLPALEPRHAGRRVLYFPGSTIGNFTPQEAHAFLERWAPLLGPGGGALIGVDLDKAPAVLDAAYNDSQGITAQFNLNLLARLNRELGANFDLDRFRHHAFYDPPQYRIEMHLRSTARQRVTIAGHEFTFRDGETIHTENSYKYSVSGFGQLARSAGYTPVRCWTDQDGLFSVHWLALPQS